MSWIFHVIVPKKQQATSVHTDWSISWAPGDSDSCNTSAMKDVISTCMIQGTLNTSSPPFFPHKSTVPAVKRPYLKVANLPRHMQHMAALAFSERNGRCSSASWSNHACKTSSEIRPGSKLEDHPKNGHSLHVFLLGEGYNTVPWLCNG